MTHEATELELYITNTSDIYHNFLMPAYENLKKKKSKGTYDSDKAAKLFYHVATNSAKAYHSVHGSMFSKWFNTFSVSNRWEVANSLRDTFEAEYACNGCE